VGLSCWLRTGLGSIHRTGRDISLAVAYSWNYKLTASQKIAFRAVFCYAPYMNNNDKQYIDKKFAEAQLMREKESGLVKNKLQQRKSRLLKIFSIYAVIMLIVIAVLVFYIISSFQQ
jgi:hypothetical protein